MIELAPIVSPHRLPALDDWFPAGTPGPAAIGEHMMATGLGRWWVDRPVRPRAIAAPCAGYVVLRGSSQVLTPKALAPLAGTRIDAPVRFLPALGAAFQRLTPCERMIGPCRPSRSPPGCRSA